MARFLTDGMRRQIKWVLWVSAVVMLLLSLWRLEAERATVLERDIATGVGEVSLYTKGPDLAGPLVVVAHGFAGSRQMMQYISRDLARAGFTVAAFDFYGQGRNPQRMSSDVSRIEGTTLQLVAQTRAVIDAVRAETGVKSPVALLGHSMATDIVIRAAADLPEQGPIVAISMYSEAVSGDFPARLLILSGAWETRLREVGRDAVALVGGRGVEGETVVRDGVLRRAVSIPGTEHVAVLFAPATMEETRAWVQEAYDIPDEGQTWAQGGAIVATLAALVILFWPLSRLLPQRPMAKPEPLALKSFLAAAFLPAFPATVVPLFIKGGLLGSAAFGSLVVFFGIWGVLSLALLARTGRRLDWPDIRGTVFLLFWGLGVFALALDRYAAAFLPVGPRFGLMLVLMIGTVPFMLADRLLLAGADLWQRVLARALPILALAVCMISHPGNMGLLFTVLPVMVLFHAVFGTMARAVAQRSGAVSAGLGQGVVLAWSIAASTPLFVG